MLLISAGICNLYLGVRLIPSILELLTIQNKSSQEYKMVAWKHDYAENSCRSDAQRLTFNNFAPSLSVFI